MKLLQQIGILSIFALSSACSTDPYNVVTEKTQDKQANSQYVYGDGKGKPARQTQNKYTSTPEDQKRADAIREKMFGKGISAEATATAPDTTKKEGKDAKKTEAKKEETKKEEKK